MVPSRLAFYDYLIFATLQPDKSVRRTPRFAKKYCPKKKFLKVVDDMKIRFLVGPIAGLALVACGGGGGGNPAAVLPVSAVAPVASVATASVFADPVDVKCDTINGDKICDAPTSSKMDKAKLQTLLSDSTASNLKFKVFGYAFAYDNFRTRQGNGQYFAISGQSAYEGSDQELIASAGAVRFTGTAYPFLKVYPGTTYSRGYCLTQKQDDCVFVNPVNGSSDDSLYGDLVPVVYTQGAATLTADSLTSRIKTWSSYVGAASDKTDVVIPASGTIKYVGILWLRGGDGSPAKGGVTIQAGVAACPIELSLNVATGKIDAVDVACSGNATGDLSISLPALTVDNSKVQQIKPTDAAIGSAKVILEIVTSGSGTPPPNEFSESFSFETSKIAGGLYGSNARTLLIMGGGPKGVLSIVARRQ